MLIGGAGLALIGHSMLMVEGRISRPAGSGARSQGFLDFVARTRYAAVAGGLLVGLSTFQGEFDFGVPQFRLLFHPVLIAAAAGVALVAARTYSGRGGALGAAAYFIVIRGTVGLLVGPVLGETTPHMPLYLVEAGLVEAAALLVPTSRPYLFGATSGVLIGTAGFAAEWAWSHVWMPTPWPASLFGEAIVAVLVVAVAAGMLGAFVGSALAAPRRAHELGFPRVAPAALALVAIVAVVGYGLDTKPERGVSATVALRDVTPAPDRTVQATVRIDPPSATKDADWIQAMAWQGGGFKAERLHRVAPGIYRTTKPLPVHGDWKTMIRLQRKRSVLAVPVYLPKDTAIPAPALSAPARFQRQFVREKDVLQREQKSGVPASLTTLAYAAVGSIALSLILMLGWALVRLGVASLPDGAPRRRRRHSARPAGMVAPEGGAL
jgi:hypothetical protein